MEILLENLSEQLKNSRPDFYKQLLAPLAPEEIQKLEQTFDTQLPQNLKALYSWKNGQQGFEAFVNNSMLLSLEEALRISKMLTAMIGKDFDRENWWNKAWIPLFHNGGGDYICYDTEGVFTGQKGQILKHYHDYEARNILAPNLEAFLESLNTFYKKTPTEELDEYFEVSLEGYPKRFKV